MLDAIAKPFGILMMWLYELTNNYLMAIVLFSLVVKLILLPFQIKSKKSTMRQQLLMPQQQEIQKKHGANKQKYQEEITKLYQEEGINPMSGCLWALLPFPILIALYGAIRSPITVMMGVAKEQLQEGGALLGKLTELGFKSAGNSGYLEIEQAKFISSNWSEFVALNIEKLKNINYTSFGLDLGATPSWQFWTWDWSSFESWGHSLALLMIPVLAAVLTWIPTKITKKLNAETMRCAGLEDSGNPAADAGMGMMLLMPLMTLVFCFIMPAGLGVYWIANSVFGLIQDVVLTKRYNKTIAAQSAERIAARRAREAELEAKRLETEKRRAENATTQNAATSKRRQQNKKKRDQAERSQEWQRIHGGEEQVYEPSRVGNRRYARGRAYDPDRFAFNGVEGATESTSSVDDSLTEEQEERLELAATPEEEPQTSDVQESDD